MGNITAKSASEKHLGYPIATEIWAQIDREGYLEEWGSPAADSGLRARLTKKIARRSRELSNAPRRLPTARPTVPHEVSDTRAWILSCLSAKDARRRPDVRRFRREELKKRLLEPCEIGSWIERNVGEIDLPQERLELKLPPGHHLVQDMSHDTVTWRIEPPLELDVVMVAHERDGEWYPSAAMVSKRAWARPILEWSDPTEHYVRRTPVREDSMLDRLRLLSERLAEDYGWLPAQVVNFVLSDTVPIVRHLSIQCSTRTSGAKGRGRLRTLVTISAEAWVSPDDVKKAYRKARGEIGVRGTGPLKGKIGRLVEFVVRLEHGSTWQQKMEMWNSEGAQSSSERYVLVRRFHRDFNRAVDRLGPVLQIGSKVSTEGDLKQQPAKTLRPETKRLFRQRR